MTCVVHTYIVFFTNFQLTFIFRCSIRFPSTSIRLFFQSLVEETESMDSDEMPSPPKMKPLNINIPQAEGKKIIKYYQKSPKNLQNTWLQILFLTAILSNLHQKWNPETSTFHKHPNWCCKNNGSNKHFQTCACLFNSLSDYGQTLRSKALARTWSSVLLLRFRGRQGPLTTLLNNLVNHF